jgi:hypothetical protein
MTSPGRRLPDDQVGTGLAVVVGDSAGRILVHTTDHGGRQAAGQLPIEAPSTVCTDAKVGAGSDEVSPIKEPDDEQAK